LAPTLATLVAETLVFLRLFSTLWGFHVIWQWDLGHFLGTVLLFPYDATVLCALLKKLLASNPDYCPIQKKDNRVHHSALLRMMKVLICQPMKNY
jgi:hypothetical protein